MKFLKVNLHAEIERGTRFVECDACAALIRDDSDGVLRHQSFHQHLVRLANGEVGIRVEPFGVHSLVERV